MQDDSASGGVDPFYRGELKVGLKYLPSGGSKPIGTLVIDVKQAKELPAMSGETSDSAVKLHLLPNRKSSGKRKTGVLKNNLNPVWEEKFTYEDVSLEELSHERVLEISVWNYDKRGNTFIGGLRIGPAPGSATKHKDWMDSIGDEVTHWEDMLARPGEWVEQWHTLRTTMNPRSVDLLASASTPAPLPTSHTPPPPQEEPSVATTTTQVVLAQPSVKSATDESSKTAPIVAPVVHTEEKETESQVHITAQTSSGEAKEKTPKLQTATPTKPVFSSSVRSRPNRAPIQATTEPPDVKTVQADLSTISDSGASVLKTPSPQLGHSSKEGTPSIRVEGERTPHTPPRVHSTPVGKGMDLSEAGSYTEESQGSTESHGHQVSYIFVEYVQLNHSVTTRDDHYQLRVSGNGGHNCLCNVHWVR